MFQLHRLPEFGQNEANEKSKHVISEELMTKTYHKCSMQRTVYLEPPDMVTDVR